VTCCLPCAVWIKDVFLVGQYGAQVCRILRRFEWWWSHWIWSSIDVVMSSGVFFLGDGDGSGDCARAQGGAGWAGGLPSAAWANGVLWAQ
jgi:hypothetical protein